jgi:hypothetical protein
MDSTDGLRGWRRGRRGALLAVAAVVGLLLASQASAAGGPLRLSDAPVGWVAGPHDPDGESAGRGLCSFQARTRAVEADRTVFEDPVGTGRLNSRWLAFARPRAARRYLRELRAALRSCTSYTGTGPNGEAIVITVAPAAFPTLGDESVAFLQQLTLHGQLRRAGYTIHARRGSRVAISSSPTTRSRTPASRCCWPGGRRAGHSAHPVASPVVWPGESPQMAASTLGDDELLAVLGRTWRSCRGTRPPRR